VDYIIIVDMHGDLDTVMEDADMVSEHVDMVSEDVVGEMAVDMVLVDMDTEHVVSDVDLLDSVLTTPTMPVVCLNLTPVILHGDVEVCTTLDM
jgi:hypothetical protein